MNWREADRALSCESWRNARMDWVSADIVERGIEMQTDKGYDAAFHYLEEHDISPDVIRRVLVDRFDRRSQSFGAL